MIGEQSAHHVCHVIFQVEHLFLVVFVLRHQNVFAFTPKIWTGLQLVLDCDLFA